MAICETVVSYDCLLLCVKRKVVCDDVSTYILPLYFYLYFFNVLESVSYGYSFLDIKKWKSSIRGSSMCLLSCYVYIICHGSSS